VQTRNAWIAAAASGWALAIFAGGVLVGGALDDDPRPSRPGPPEAREEAARGAAREQAQTGDLAGGGPVRVALREVRGELAIGPRGRRGGGRPNRGGPARGGTGAILARRPGRSRVGARRASSAVTPPAANRAPASRGRPGVRRRVRARPPRIAPPPVVPLAHPGPPPQRGHGRPKKPRTHGNGQGRGGGDDDDHSEDDDDD
jgi:hypothetical protein